jgi:hypothetical protein
VPPVISKHYTSESRPQNRWKSNPLRDLKRYTERWREILKRMQEDIYGVQTTIPEMPMQLQDWLKKIFPLVLKAFRSVDKGPR